MDLQYSEKDYQVQDKVGLIDTGDTERGRDQL
jgi:hypothetical protein